MTYGMDHTMLNYNVVATHKTSMYFLGEDNQVRMYAETSIRKDLPFMSREDPKYSFDVAVMFEKRHTFLWIPFWLVCKAVHYKEEELKVEKIYGWYKQYDTVKAIEEIFESSISDIKWPGWCTAAFHMGNEPTKFLSKFWQSITIPNCVTA